MPSRLIAGERISDLGSSRLSAGVRFRLMPSRSSQEIVRFIHSYIQELDEVRINTSKNSNVKIKWRHPPGNRIKINFDGAFDERSKVSASGVVVRDSSGNILISSTDIQRGVPSAFAAEAIACRRATQIALDMNEEDIIIEGDSLTIGPYIYDIHSMKPRGRRLKFEFIPRSANNPAHVLATESLRRKEGFYLFNNVPEYAVVQARNDSVREPD
ncbi:reverse transcriptase [Gossypium australe]|uniref:Reverse transcriptase n=1 Tax=Gossypium australe TaxID=47621 RepID=A0A5B6WLW9_9ROSI|nr:reverse transcriptase [Gossypium australe]